MNVDACNDGLVQSMQTMNTCVVSRDVTRIKLDNHGLKLSLAAFNDDCWILIGSPTISRQKMKDKEFWRMCIRKRRKSNSIKGKDVRSMLHNTKIEAEMTLCSFRCSLDGKMEKNLWTKRQHH